MAKVGEKPSILTYRYGHLLRNAFPAYRMPVVNAIPFMTENGNRSRQDIAEDSLPSKINLFFSIKGDISHSAMLAATARHPARQEKESRWLIWIRTHPAFPAAYVPMTPSRLWPARLVGEDAVASSAWQFWTPSPPATITEGKSSSFRSNVPSTLVIGHLWDILSIRFFRHEPTCSRVGSDLDSTF